MLESNLKTKMRNSIIELLIERRQIYNDFCNFGDEQAGNVTKPTPNFELELEVYLKEPASTDIIKKI